MTTNNCWSLSSGRSRVPRIIFVACVMLAIFDCSPAEQKPERIRWRQCLDQPADWYSSEEAIRIGDNLLLFEYPSGGWPKNIDMAQELSELRKEQILHERKNDSSTIDNAATYTQLRYLARIYTSTKLDRFRASFLKGFDYLITAQYSNGGWPAMVAQAHAISHEEWRLARHRGPAGCSRAR